MKKTLGRVDYLDDVVILPGNLTWQDRLKEWIEKPMSLEVRLSWLDDNWHSGYDSPDIFIFYLNLAYGYGGNIPRIGTGKVFWNRGEKVYESAVKFLIRARAFRVLANHFFNLSDENSNPNYPFQLPYTNPLFENLLGFFMGSVGVGGVDNFNPMYPLILGKDGGKHYLATAKKFAELFTTNSLLILFGSSPFVYYDGTPKLDPNIFWNNRYLIINLARKLQILDVVASLIKGGVRQSIHVTFFEILFNECNEEVEIPSSLGGVFRDRDVELALKRCVQKRNELALFMNNFYYTHR
jgi:hypothetical protein